ncbi:MAG: zinc-ribbon domain-containing protein [Desulfobacteraceae bacterium]|jgi:CheY-like chemotaxis protein
MDIICQSCQGKLKIADGRLPEGRTASVKCPRCKSVIKITPQDDAAGDTDAAFDDLFDFDEDEGDGYDSAEKPFDFIEEEGKSALVCESDALIREKIRPAMNILEYHITEVPNSREALKKMRYHTYDIIIVNEYFDTRDPDANPLLIYLERQLMEVRRNIFVVLLTSRFRTMDHMTAFSRSVNLILNVRNVDDFDKIIQRSLADYGLFYKVYKEGMTS